MRYFKRAILIASAALCFNLSAFSQDITLKANKSHRYYPLVGREQYARGVMSSVLTSYFDGSLARMVSFFSRNEDISVKEMDEILEIMRNAKK